MIHRVHFVTANYLSVGIMSAEEQILVIPSDVIFSLGSIDRFTTDVDRFLPAILAK